MRQSGKSNGTFLPKGKLLVLLCFIFLFSIMPFTLGNWPLPKPKPRKITVEKQAPVPLEEEVLRDSLKWMDTVSVSSKTIVPFLQPWGKNGFFLFNEWTHIYRSIMQDIQKPTPSLYEDDCLNCKRGGKLQILVYDTDGGYFTLSLAKFIPGVQLTNVVFDRYKISNRGPSYFSASQGMNIIENKWREFYNSSSSVLDSQLFVCSSAYISVARLGGIAGAGALAHYQLVFSLFDQIAYPPTKLAFQRAFISVLKGSSVATFINLPMFGYSPMSLRQHLPRWYNVSQKPEDFIQDTASLFSVNLSVVRLATLQRESINYAVLRVTVLHPDRQSNSVVPCKLRKQLLRCNSIGVFSNCSL